MSSRHPDISSSIQLPSVLQASREPLDRIAAADCFLCDWEAILRENNTHTAINETLVVTPEQFRRHLGSHMEQLALFALPRSYNDEEVDAASNEAAAIINSGSMSRNSSRNITLSWKTISDHEVKQDLAVPDLATNTKIVNSSSSLPAVTPDRKQQDPWSSRKLERDKIGGAFPRYGASVNEDRSDEVNTYIYGGLVNGKTLKCDLWLIRTSQEGEFHCKLIPTHSKGPSPTVGAAAVLAGNDFIIFWRGC